MAEVKATETDIFQQQAKTIALSQKLLASKLNSQPQQVFVQAAAPRKKAPNYTMYAIGAAVFYLMFVKKGKLL